MFFKFQFITAEKNNIVIAACKTPGSYRSLDTGPLQNTYSLTVREMLRLPPPFRCRAAARYAFTHGARNAPVSTVVSIPGHRKIRIHLRDAKRPGFHCRFDTGPPQNTYSLTGCETPRFPPPSRYRAAARYAFTHGVRNAPVSAAVPIPGYRNYRIGTASMRY